MLTTPKSTSINVKKINSEGKEEFIDLAPKIGDLAPQLAIPNVIDVIVNTTAPNVDTYADAKFRILAKPTPETVIENGQYVKKHTQLKKNGIKVDLATITPTKIAEVFQLDEVDLESGNFEEEITKTAANWLVHVNQVVQRTSIKKMLWAAQEFNKKIIADESNRKTAKFANGAHMEYHPTNSPLTAKQAEDAIKRCKYAMQRIGTENAFSEVDQFYKFADGIDLTDIAFICSDEFRDTLLSSDSLKASDSGIQLFKEMDIKRVMGIDMLVTSALPTGAHFVMLTTGRLGAFAKGPVADGFFNAVKPGDFKNSKMELEKTFYAGVVHQQLIFAFVDEDFMIDEDPTFELATKSSDVVVKTASSFAFENNDKKTQSKKKMESEKEKVKETLKGNQESNEQSDNDLKAKVEELLNKEELTAEEQQFLEEHQDLVN